MNRPKTLDYNINTVMLYVTDLEYYCNFIERKLETTNEALNDHIKALDKACDMLATYDLANRYRMERAPYSDEEWKEWLMKDERTD